MAIELITGRAGKAHIGSEDDRTYHAYTNGEGRYILNGGTVDIESANNVHIDPVEFLIDGAHVRVTGAGEDVAIENGIASYKRIDVIALHYTRTGNEGNYIESVEFAVVKGANVELGSEPQVPDMPKSSTILTGANDVYVPVYSLLIDGLTPKNLTTLLEQYALPVELGGTGKKTLSAFIDSVWNYIKTKADAVYAKVAHVHTAADITSGTLPVSHGGTGATNANDARTNIGMKKLLWSGTLTGDTSINVPGLRNYGVIEVHLTNTDAPILLSLNKTKTSYDGGINSWSSSQAFMLGASLNIVSDDTVKCGSSTGWVQIAIDRSWISINNSGITEIWGVA